MLLSEVSLPEHHPRAGPRCVVFGFLVDHPHGPVLVDTGVGVGHPTIDRLFTPTHHSLDRALAARGVALDDVVMVVNSHLHFDHCGNNRLFPGVPLVVQRTEHRVAHIRGHTVAKWVDFPGAEWVLVDGENEVLPGLTVVPTPGHTDGHQSVVVSRAGAIEVIAGQTLYDPSELDAEASAEPLSAPDAEHTAASALRIKALDPSLVLFSHSPDVWRKP